MVTPRPNTYSAASGGTVRAGGGVVLSPGNVRISIWGQSNAQGRAERSDISASPLSSDPGLAIYDAGTFDRVYLWAGSSYSKLQPSVSTGTFSGMFGPEFGLAVRWMRETVAGNLYLDKVAIGGTSITTYLPSSFDMYSSGLSWKSSQNGWLASAGVSLSGGSVLWVQGESDASQTEAWYRTRLDELAGGWVSDGFVTAGGQIVLVQMSPDGGYSAAVAAAKTNAAAANPGLMKVISMQPYKKPGDVLHINGRGQVQLAYDAFEALFSAPHINT